MLGIVSPPAFGAMLKAYFNRFATPSREGFGRSCEPLAARPCTNRQNGSGLKTLRLAELTGDDARSSLNATALTVALPSSVKAEPMKPELGVGWLPSVVERMAAPGVAVESETVTILS